MLDQTTIFTNIQSPFGLWIILSCHIFKTVPSVLARAICFQPAGILCYSALFLLFFFRFSFWFETWLCAVFLEIFHCSLFFIYLSSSFLQSHTSQMSRPIHPAWRGVSPPLWLKGLWPSETAPNAATSQTRCGNFSVSLGSPASSQCSR